MHTRIRLRNKFEYTCLGQQKKCEINKFKISPAHRRIKINFKFY